VCLLVESVEPRLDGVLHGANFGINLHLYVRNCAQAAMVIQSL
jgi:hypothetical protein